MADLNVALILRLVDRATGPARAAMRAIERIGGDSLVRQAQKAQAASAMIAGGVGSIAGTATRGGLAVAAYGAGIGALAASFVRPAAQFEQFNVQLTALEGSSAKAEKAMAWIEDFATRTPLELEDTVAAYAKLKAFGLDPTEGSLQALVDTMAASGGGAEQLNGLVLALGQSWTKGKLQGEEAMQMLERGVPVWDLLSAKMGKTSAELMEMASNGKLGRAEILLLVEALAEQNAGASGAMAKTWGGITSNLRDHWTKFQRMVMGSGLFDYLKDKLSALLDTLNQMAADGSLQEWADWLGTKIIATFDTIEWALKGVFFFVKDSLYPELDSIQQMLGGWDVLGWSVLMLLYSRTLFAVAAAFKAIGAGLLALSANPLVLFGALVIASGLAVWAIHKQWNDVGNFFNQKFADIAAEFDRNWFVGWQKFLIEFNPTTLLAEWVVGIPLLIAKAFDVDLYGAGVKMLETLLNGIKAKMGEVAAYVTGAVSAMFPGYQAGGLAALVSADAPQNRDYPYGTNFNEAAKIRPGAVPPGKALGGPVRAGQVYRWQEEGQEFFVPRTDGTVISNRQLRTMQAATQIAERYRPAEAAALPSPPGREVTVMLAPPMQAATQIAERYRPAEAAAMPSPPDREVQVVAAPPLRGAGRGPAGRAAPAFHIGAINITAAAGQSARDVALAVQRALEDMARGAPLHDGGAYGD